MFDLASLDLAGGILDCAGGAASFNAETTRRGYRVVSCDPIYRYPAQRISDRIDETYETVLMGAKANRDRYVWDEIGSPEKLGEIRIAAMQRFLDDFPQGLKEGRYRPYALPNIRLGNGEFDLALCSHLLFTYSEQLTLNFHVAAIEEMCRIAGEARIFPLLSYSGEPSPLLDPVLDELRGRDYQAEVRPVPYEFQRGGNKLLIVKR